MNFIPNRNSTTTAARARISELVGDLLGDWIPPRDNEAICPATGGAFAMRSLSLICAITAKRA